MTAHEMVRMEVASRGRCSRADIYEALLPKFANEEQLRGAISTALRLGLVVRVEFNVYEAAR